MGWRSDINRPGTLVQVMALGTVTLLLGLMGLAGASGGSAGIRVIGALIALLGLLLIVLAWRRLHR